MSPKEKHQGRRNSVCRGSNMSKSSLRAWERGIILNVGNAFKSTPLKDVIFVANVSQSRCERGSTMHGLYSYSFVATPAVAAGTGQTTLGLLLTADLQPAARLPAPISHPDKANATDPRECFCGLDEMICCVSVRAGCSQCLARCRACWREGEGLGTTLAWAKREPWAKSGLRPQVFINP